MKWSVKQMDFSDKWEAIAWMCKNQLGRRNLTEEQKSYLRGRQYEAEKMSQGGDRKSEEFSKGQNVHLKSRREQQDGTSGRIGRENGVDGRTVRRDADFANGLDAAEAVSPGIRDAVLSGEVKAPKKVISAARLSTKIEQICYKAHRGPYNQRKRLSGVCIPPTLKRRVGAFTGLVEGANETLYREGDGKLPYPLPEKQIGHLGQVVLTKPKITFPPLVGETHIWAGGIFKW